MTRIKQYLQVYREFLATSFSEATSYRAHFVLMLVMQLTFYLTSLASVDFLFAHVGKIGVWNREQFLFFVAFMLAVDELHMTFVSDGFWVLSRNIRSGNLDFDLLRPLSLFFTVFFRHIRPANFLLLPVSWGLVAYFGVQAELPAWGWAVLPLLILASFALIVSIEILIAASMFITIDGTGINFLRMQFQTMGRWPDFVYAPTPRRFLTFFVPVLMVGNAPVRFLFDPHDSLLMLMMLPTLGLTLWLNQVVWRQALRRYHSASS